MFVPFGNKDGKTALKRMRPNEEEESTLNPEIETLFQSKLEPILNALQHPHFNEMAVQLWQAFENGTQATDIQAQCERFHLALCKERTRILLPLINETLDNPIHAILRPFIKAYTSEEQANAILFFSFGCEPNAHLRTLIYNKDSKSFYRIEDCSQAPIPSRIQTPAEFNLKQAKNMCKSMHKNRCTLEASTKAAFHTAFGVALEQLDQAIQLTLSLLKQEIPYQVPCLPSPLSKSQKVNLPETTEEHYSILPLMLAEEHSIPPAIEEHQPSSAPPFLSSHVEEQAPLASSASILLLSPSSLPPQVPSNEEIMEQGEVPCLSDTAMLEKPVVVSSGRFVFKLKGKLSDYTVKAVTTSVVGSEAAKGLNPAYLVDQ